MPPYIEALRYGLQSVPQSHSAACACRPTLKRPSKGSREPLRRLFGGMRMPPYIEAVVACIACPVDRRFGGMRMPPYIEACEAWGPCASGALIRRHAHAALH